MKITITAVAELGKPLPNPLSFVLAAGGKESPKDLKINGTRNMQTAQFLRSPATKSFDRKNRTTVVSFSVTRLFDTTADAQDFLLTHETQCPGGGYLTIEDNSGDVYYLRDCVLSTLEGNHMGATTFHSYQITGGIISTT